MQNILFYRSFMSFSLRFCYDWRKYGIVASGLRFGSLRSHRGLNTQVSCNENQPKYANPRVLITVLVRRFRSGSIPQHSDSN